MRRFLSIELPSWPLQRLLVDRPEGKRNSLVLWQKDPRRGQRVMFCSRTARRLGARPGMPLSEALAMGVYLAWEWDPQADRQALLNLVRICEQFSPLVGWDDSPAPTGLLMEVTGLGARWGGEAALAARVREVLRDRGYLARIAIADTIGAAWALARFSEESLCVVAPGQVAHALAPLSVACLRLANEPLTLLHRLGLVRVEQLLRLPRAGIGTRLGSDVLQRLDQALGDTGELLCIHPSEPCWTAEWRFDQATERREHVTGAVRRLSDELSQRLASRELGALQLVCRFESDSFGSDAKEPSKSKLPVPSLSAGTLDSWTGRRFVWDVRVGFFRPTADAAHWWALLRSPVEEVRWPAPVLALELSAPSTARLVRYQRGLWSNDESQDQAHELAQLIDRFSQRLGHEYVCATRLRAGTLPEEAYVALPLTGPLASHARLTAATSPRTYAAGHRPLHLVEPPQKVSQCQLDACGVPSRFLLDAPAERGARWQHVAHAWGPERLETGWWRGPVVRRDYYRVESTDGFRYWLFQNLDSRVWFLHGYFS